MEVLVDIVAILLCAECKFPSMNVEQLRKQGCAVNFKLNCGCGWDLSFLSSKIPVLKNKETFSSVRGFDVNKRFFYATCSCGIGLAGMETFCTLMNMPPPSTRKNYCKQGSKIEKAVVSVAEIVMLAAATEVCLYYQK